jgi:Tol biopolymer transport system component
MADIPLNLDAMVIDIDGEARALSKPRGIVTGYHEDFTPAWSPDGKWLAYHSHRSPKAVSIFDERGSTDDIYLRRVDGLSPEIRLTDFGHETGSASWLPDSRRLVFDSQDIGITPAVTRTWVVEIDPDSGKAVSKKELLRPAGVRSLESVAFSPSGRELALLGEAENGKAIWVQDVEKGSLQRLAPYAASTHGGIDWAPDERTLIYSALGAEHMEIFSVTRNQGSWGEPRRVAAEADADLLQPQVSPDGRFIACARVKWTKRLMRKDVLE